jgi:hypothetical protein
LKNDLTPRETQGLLATLVAAPAVFVVLFALVRGVIGGDLGLLLGVIVASLAFAAVPIPMARMFSGATEPATAARPRAAH